MEAHQILSWFDLFDWALTPEEYAVFGVGVPEGAKIKDGFVVAQGRENLTWLRRRKSTWAWRKLKKARRWTRVLACVPFVRMIVIGNALGYGNCRDESDIDLVIVTAPHRVWFVRLLVVGLLRIFRQRPGEHGRDALCPSFFLSADALCLESLQIDNSTFSARGGCASGANIQPYFAKASQGAHSTFPPDPYLLFWMTQLTVLYDVAGTYDSFWKANEQWVRRWLPDAQPRGAHPRLQVTWPAKKVSPLPAGRGSGRGWRVRIGDACERWVRHFQDHRFPPEIRALANADSRVVVNDRMIKLHTDDRRTEYRDRWLEVLRT